MGIMSVVTILSVIVISVAPDETMANSSEMGNAIECRKTLFHDVIIQKDKMGRKCSDWVGFWGCQGRCSSHVIGHWKFPYKKYTHRVCIHGQRIQSQVTLRNCDEGVSPGTEIYEYIEAGECSCSICNSSETSCEGAHKRGPPSPPVQETDDVINDVVIPVETATPQWTYLSPSPPHPSIPLNDVVYSE